MRNIFSSTAAGLRTQVVGLPKCTHLVVGLRKFTQVAGLQRCTPVVGLPRFTQAAGHPRRTLSAPLTTHHLSRESSVPRNPSSPADGKFKRSSQLLFDSFVEFL
jgi:hypothetical protein